MNIRQGTISLPALILTLIVIAAGITGYVTFSNRQPLANTNETNSTTNSSVPLVNAGTNTGLYCSVASDCEIECMGNCAGDTILTTTCTDGECRCACLDPNLDYTANQNANTSANTNSTTTTNNNTNDAQSIITLYPLEEMIQDLADYNLKVGTFQTFGTVVEHRFCAECPPGALCAECEPDAIVVGAGRMATKTIAFTTDNPETYPVGYDAVFTVRIKVKGLEPELLSAGQP